MLGRMGCEEFGKKLWLGVKEIGGEICCWS